MHLRVNSKDVCTFFMNWLYFLLLSQGTDQWIGMKQTCISSDYKLVLNNYKNKPFLGPPITWGQQA